MYQPVFQLYWTPVEKAWHSEWSLVQNVNSKSKFVFFVSIILHEYALQSIQHIYYLTCVMTTFLILKNYENFSRRLTVPLIRWLFSLIVKDLGFKFSVAGMLLLLWTKEDSGRLTTFNKGAKNTRAAQYTCFPAMSQYSTLFRTIWFVYDLFFLLCFSCRCMTVSRSRILILNLCSCSFSLERQ